MAKSSVFISFDYDNDKGIKELLIGQSKNSDTPFEIADWSIKDHLTGDWKEKARTKIKQTDQVVVLCGQYNATGVNAELKLAQEEGIPYFLLRGYKDKKCTFPSTSKSSDKMYDWTWDNLKKLIGGAR
ncbi:TIR domain-containing protein [Teredinibacter purpureus]|uniref:TIR domain-containing protein n=1 Tax=Teredinibacter purpureus TaxID=2731756 RepID=UPI0005F78FB1|nr:TIR domain-containing protein [Teredinibacter purpureus]